ncbi:hypothetical protein, partial [Chromobacterium vaccinii]|uniref:hypothetical protein n=1 Tax=Chromobacterium vaccinii TaxID=1108595 RepID=UPI001E4A03A4
TDSQSVQIKAWEVAKPLTGNGDVVTVGAVPVRNGGAVTNPAGKSTVFVGLRGPVQFGAKLNLGFKSWGWNYGIYSCDSIALGVKLPSAFEEMEGDSWRVSIERTLRLTKGGEQKISKDVFTSFQGLGAMDVKELGFFHGVNNADGGQVAYDRISLAMSVYKKTSYGDVLVASGSSQSVDISFLGREVNLPFGNGVAGQQNINFEKQPPDANRLLLLSRPAGSTAGWNIANVPPMQINGQNAAGWFAYDWSGMARGNYEYRYLALDAAGNVKNSGQGQMALNDGAPT